MKVSATAELQNVVSLLHPRDSDRWYRYRPLCSWNTMKIDNAYYNLLSWPTQFYIRFAYKEIGNLGQRTSPADSGDACLRYLRCLRYSTRPGRPANRPTGKTFSDTGDKRLCTTGPEILTRCWSVITCLDAREQPYNKFSELYLYL